MARTITLQVSDSQLDLASLRLYIVDNEGTREEWVEARFRRDDNKVETVRGLAEDVLGVGQATSLFALRDVAMAALRTTGNLDPV